MSEAFFTIHSASQTVKVTTDYISGRHDILNAYLNVHLSFAMRTTKADIAFDLLPVNARLFFREPQQLLSETRGHLTTSVYNRESLIGYHISFPLNAATMHFIEKHRDKDLNLGLDLDIHALVKSATAQPGAKSAYSVDYIHSETVKIYFEIPRSVWIEKILPEMGYRNLKLFEIPVSHSILNEAYDHIISNFDEAERYFNLQDYNKCVSHCRMSLDTLNTSLANIRKEVTSKSNYKWLRTVNEETFIWLDKVVQTTFSITSKPHHAGPQQDFTRYEAESIYLVTLALLNYIGNLQP